MKEICSPTCDFFVGWHLDHAVFTAVNHIVHPVNVPLNPKDISLHFVNPSFKYSLKDGGDLIAQVYLRNKGPAPIPSGTLEFKEISKVSGKELFLPFVHSFDKPIRTEHYSFEMHLPRNPNADLDTFTGQLDFRITGSGEPINGMLSFPTKFFLKDIEDFGQRLLQLVPSVNVLLVGPSGAGKSTLVNRIVTSFAADTLKEWATVCDEVGPCTKEVTGHNLAPRFPLRLFDTPPIQFSSSSDYVTDLIRYSAYEEEPTPEKTKEDKEPTGVLWNEGTKNKIHSVVFLVSPDFANEAETSSKRIKLIEQINEVKKVGYEPLLVVSRWESVTEKAQLESKLSEITGITKVLPIGGNPRVRMVSLASSLDAIKVLDSILQSAESWIQANQKITTTKDEL